MDDAGAAFKCRLRLHSKRPAPQHHTVRYQAGNARGRKITEVEQPEPLLPSFDSKNAEKVKKNCSRSFLYIYGRNIETRQKEEQRKVPTDYLNVCENCLSLDLMRHFLVSWLTSSAERPVRSSSEGARLTLSDCLNYYLERGWHIPNRPCIRQ